VIARFWRAWATPQNAALYADFLEREFLPELPAIAGYRGAQLMQRPAGDEVEALVITWWDSLDAIAAFAGDDVEAAHVAPKARALLSRFEARCRHFETVFEHRV
jgi:heme-degrading monooxygenase HmoA